MSRAEPTIAELRALAAHSTPATLALEWLLPADHATRTKLVERAIDWSIIEMVKFKQAHQDKSEDELTFSLIGPLRGMGIDAAHDTQIGGHVDIVVQGRNDFVWLAEAKKHGTYDWLLDGYEQLDRRYSTGLSGQDSGDFIIYHYGTDSVRVMSNWIEHLKTGRPDVEIVAAGDETDELTRRSKHLHTGTGLPFNVRHRIVPLHFSPTV